MIQFTQKQLKELVKVGAAKDVTHERELTAIPENYTQIGYSCGIYGCNGKLFKGFSGKLYAITSNTIAIYTF